MSLDSKDIVLEEVQNCRNSLDRLIEVLVKLADYEVFSEKLTAENKALKNKLAQYERDVAC